MWGSHRAARQSRGTGLGPAARHACVLLALTAAACDVRVGDEGVSVGVSAGRAVDEWARSYTLPRAARVQIVSFNGPVEVRPAEGSQVEVQVVREARGTSDEAAREALERIEILEEAGGDQVSVTVRPADDTAAARRGRRPGVTVRVSVRVPPGVALSVSTQNGPIDVADVTGHLTAAVSNGPLRATGISGSVAATAVNGGVDLDFAALDAPTAVTVVNGGIRLALPGGARATLSGGITNGRLQVDDSFALSGAPEPDAVFAGQQRLGGTINGGGPMLTIQATNGSAQIVPRTAPPDPSRR